jgi:hypothetical protein
VTLKIELWKYKNLTFVYKLCCRAHIMMVKYRFMVTSCPLSPITSLLQCDTFLMLQLCFSHILMYLLMLCMYEQKMAGVWYFTACRFLVSPTVCNLNNSYIDVSLQGIRGNKSKIQHPVTEWRWTVSFMSPATLPLGKQAPAHSVRGRLGPRAHVDTSGRRKTYHLSEIKPQSLSHPAHSLVIVPTVLVTSYQH